MWRHIYSELLDWKNSAEHRPLILDGVRQCGKTYILKELGKEFDECVYLNFEREHSLNALFETDLDPERIIRDIELLKSVKIEPGSTLLILDEIQDCGNAITSLKYFCEEIPKLHVACAGSLLGVMKSSTSYPVGKVCHMELYPMSFIEFIVAEGKDRLAEFITLGADGIREPFHSELLRLLRDYCIVGGMPKVVDSWTQEHNILKVDSLQKELLKDYENDFAKHGGNMIETLTAIWTSLPSFLSRENRRFIFKEFKKNGRASDFRDPVQWLVNAHLVHKVDQIKKHAYPPSTEDEDGLYKLYMCDIGLLRAMAGHPAGIMLTEEDDMYLYKGGMYENLVVCEMKAYGIDRLFYWRDGKYEVDIIAPVGGRTVPIEVKSGTDFNLKSLNVYLERYDVKISEVISMRPYQKNEKEYVPFYSIEWMVGRNHDRSNIIEVACYRYKRRFRR